MIGCASFGPKKRSFPSLRRVLSCLLLAAWALNVLAFHAFATAFDVKRNESGTSSSSARTDRASACARMGMGAIASPQGIDGVFCAPTGNSAPSKIIACLKVGMEAVLIAEAPGVVCATHRKGGDFLDRNEAATEKRSQFAHPHKIDAVKTCDEYTDLRILENDIVKVLMRQAAQDINPTGIRIIGAIFCSGLDLNGLNLPYSLAGC